MENKGSISINVAWDILSNQDERKVVVSLSVSLHGSNIIPKIYSGKRLYNILRKSCYMKGNVLWELHFIDHLVGGGS